MRTWVEYRKAFKVFSFYSVLVQNAKNIILMHKLVPGGVQVKLLVKEEKIIIKSAFYSQLFSEMKYPGSRCDRTPHISSYNISSGKQQN